MNKLSRVGSFLKLSNPKKVGLFNNVPRQDFICLFFLIIFKYPLLSLLKLLNLKKRSITYSASS